MTPQQQQDEINKFLVEQNLSAGGSTIDALQETVKNANLYIQQGAGDRKKKADIAKWKSDMNKYKNEINTLPTSYANAEKNYLSLAGWSWPNHPDQKFTGEAAYKNKMLYDYLQEAKKKSAAALNESQSIIQELYTLVDNYRSALIYSDNMDDLLSIRENENSNLIKATQEMKDITFTNDRRVFYEDKERENLSYNRYILYYFLFGIFIFYFIFGTKGLTIQSLRTQNFYKSKSFWIHTLLDILYLTIPLWVDIFVRYIFYLYKLIQYLMQNKAPRNVYTSL